MSERKIDLKNQWVAGLLAWLVPGAGHLYQGRHFKAAIYAVCIMGTLMYGMVLGEWRPVHWTEQKDGQRVKNWSFLLQAGVGTPAVAAYSQTRRFYSYENRPTFINTPQLTRELKIRESVDVDRLPRTPLDESVDAAFEGTLGFTEQLPAGAVTGRIQLEPRQQSFTGTFEGTVTTADGKQQSLSLKLGKALFLDRRTLGSPRRQVIAKVVDEHGSLQGSLTGTVPRSFFNWFAAPLDDAALTDVHLRLNKRFEMALVFTWIAGLLNILAVWDAVQGPAYGFGDEPPPEKDPKKKGKSSKDEPLTKEASSEKPESSNGSDREKAAAAASVSQEKTP